MAIIHFFSYDGHAAPPPPDSKWPMRVCLQTVPKAAATINLFHRA